MDRLFVVAVGELGFSGDQAQMFGTPKAGGIDPGFPLADGLLADAEFFGQLRLAHFQVQPQTFD